jgi:pSer/pThr/pTyr-binding forkhead associated (FHA) protein
MDQDGQISVDDLGSTNGVFVNGAGQMSSYLVVGDSV